MNCSKTSVVQTYDKSFRFKTNRKPFFVDIASGQKRDFNNDDNAVDLGIII